MRQREHTSTVAETHPHPEKEHQSSRPWARGLALFFGAFSLANLLGELIRPGFDATLWWIDTRALSPWLEKPFLWFASLFLLAYVFRPRMERARRYLTLGLTLGLLGVATYNVFQFYQLLWAGQIDTSLPVPLSLFIGLSLVGIASSLRGAPGPAAHGDLYKIAASFLFCLFVFPIAQMFFFGRTEYRRPADAIVVFGARAYADGRPSDALADRMRTACRLYREGLAPTLIVSGGPGDGAIHETEAMRRMAISLGVAEEDILLDPAGLNTRATVENTRALLAELGAKRVIAVSHFYHLPRIKLTYQREGLEIFTVPAKETFPLRLLPSYMAREVLALGFYYLGPFVF